MSYRHWLFVYLNPSVVFPSVTLWCSKYILDTYILLVSSGHSAASIFLLQFDSSFGVGCWEMAAFISLCYRSLQRCIDFVIHLSVHPYRVNRNCSSVLLIAATASWCFGCGASIERRRRRNERCMYRWARWCRGGLPYLAWEKRLGQKGREGERRLHQAGWKVRRLALLVSFLGCCLGAYASVFGVCEARHQLKGFWSTTPGAVIMSTGHHLPP